MSLADQMNRKILDRITLIDVDFVIDAIGEDLVDMCKNLPQDQLDAWSSVDPTFLEKVLRRTLVIAESKLKADFFDR